MKLLEDLVGLFFPRLCAGCGIALVRGEVVVCLHCLADLPRTNFHQTTENPVYRSLMGRVRIEQATAFCLFDKGGRLQHLLHQLKYNGYREVGQRMGILLGQSLIGQPTYQAVDAIIPVPLHPRKYRQRGFNQSEEIALGVARAMSRPLMVDNLKRNIHNASQTRKGRYERWENVSGIFAVKEPSLLIGKHLLLVDDVLTTGATLEACCEPLLAIEGVRVSVATLAMA